MKMVNLGDGDISIAYSAKIQGLLPFEFEDCCLQDKCGGFEISIKVDTGSSFIGASIVIDYRSLETKKSGEDVLVPVHMLERHAFDITTSIMGSLIKEKTNQL